MITVKANGRCAKAVSDEPLTTGSVGIPAVFQLSTDFDELAAIAEFRGGSQTVDVALIENRCVIPPEVLQAPGEKLWVGVYGRNGKGTVVIPTVWAEAGLIRPGVKPSGVNPAAPTPDWTAQVQAAAAEAVATANRAEEKVDAVITATAETRAAASMSERNAHASAIEAAKRAAAAKQSEINAAHSADLAEQSAAQSGYMFFEINDRGRLIYNRTENVDVDFTLEKGRLILHGN